MHKEDLLGERVYVIHNFLTPKECADFIAFSEKEGYGDAPITTAGGFVIDKEVRNNTRVMLDDFTLAAMLFERAKPLLPAQFGGWDVVGFNERFRYYRYDVGQTFAPHYDGTFYRKYHEESRLTFMIYLNADFEGGTTEFYRDSGAPKLTVRPESGMALVFEHLQLHEGAPTTSGRKYVLRTDVMYALRS